ncbi:MAG TPA: polysaccharide biosynthesis tyrosine autokinase, partial [Candidatus Polarisedimenticolia bacterium]|nr:polysaccharide biosynthesis tyrosine autokinase [Candidatus Polarisedimenticolia bacterium]
YWRTIRGGRWTIATVFCIVVAIGVIATLLQTRVYRASVTIEISPRTQRVVRVDDVSQIGAAGLGWSAEDRYFKTQLEVLRSRDVAARAFDQLGLKEHPLFREARDPVARFMAKLDVEPTPETLIVTLSMEGSDPREAADWVNAVAESYVGRNFEQANRATSDAIEALLDQMKPLRENILSREQEKFRYAREQKVYIPETQKASYNERLASLEKDYTATKLKRLELEAVFRKIEEIEREGGDYFVIPQVAKDEALRSLSRDKGELESEQRKLLVTFKPGHFKVKENEAALGKLTQRIQTETGRIISAIRTEYTLAESREKDLEGEIQQTKEEALTVSEKSATYDILKTESEEAKRIYDLVAQRVKEVDLNASLLRNNLAVLDRAQAPTAPVRPRRLINLAVSMLMGLGLGVGLVFFLEYLDNTVRSAEQLEREFALTTLSVVPRARPHTEETLSEAFSSLRTGVQFSSMNRTRRVLLVTSAAPGDGKSFTAVRLARAMARAGEKVCLVDADLRRPTVHKEAGLDQSPGLTNHLAGDDQDAPMRSILRRKDASGPVIVTSGPPPPAPAELIASERYAALMRQLKTDFDWVVLDSPPAAGFADSVLLAAQCDMVLFVVRQAGTDRDVLRRALDAVRTANPNVVGAVLNDVDLNRSENRDLYYPAYDPRAGRSATGAGRRRSAAL